MLSEALAYATRGWHLAPIHPVIEGRCACKSGEKCGSPGKHPTLGRGYKPTADAPEIVKLWGQFPGANIGIFPGPSDLVILDIDPRNGGEESLADIKSKHPFPDTPMVHTGGGGWHFYFRRPSGVLELRSGVLAPGVEVKADTGYVVAPPSMHYSGKEYAWDSGQDLNTAIEGLPHWLLRRIGSAQRAPEYTAFDPAGPIAGLLGAAFAALGLIGRRLGPDKASVICPWAKEHSTGVDYDGSTIVFAPQLGKKWGWFHCSHAHCSHRSQQEVIESLPRQALDVARASLGLDAEAQPSPPTVHAVTAVAGQDHRWTAELRYNEKGQLTRDAGNAALILANDISWYKTIRLERLSARIEWAADPPTIPGMIHPVPGDAFTDEDFTYIGHYFARKRGVTFGRESIRDAVRAAAKQNSYDSLTDYLDSLTWDGTPRVDTWLARYLGAVDNAYSTFVGRSWMISAVARAYQPGCQVDHMLVLEGHQGEGKSSALAILAGKWFLPELPRINNKDALVALLGRWIVNIEELSAVTGLSWESVKSFLTLRTDIFRAPYAALAETRPRRCVFAATTNRDDYATDDTGNRRLWPILCRSIRLDGLELDRDQIWAETVELYRRGVPWHPTDPAMRSALEVEQTMRGTDDPWVWAVLSILSEDPRPLNTRGLLGSIGVSPDRQTAKEARRLGKILRKIGFRRGASTEGMGYEWHPPPLERVRRLLAHRERHLVPLRDPGEEG